MSDTRKIPKHGTPQATAAYRNPNSKEFIGGAAAPAVHIKLAPQGFWRHRATWWRASANTLNCLIGCSIGDFAMLFYIQAYHPDTGVTLTMALAMASGLLTSVGFESVMLRWREDFGWRQAVQMAVSMSFISMLGMELVANVTDYAMTGGTVQPGTAWFWFALGVSLLAGFLAPLPYNYYKLRKHGHACH